ncbi:MAG: DUF126 domain-containing protein [Nitrososphaerales archaeon]
MRKIKCRKISKGIGEGISIVSNVPISFLGDVDPNTSLIVNKSHPLYGKSIEKKVLIFPTGRGSTVGSYILYQLMKNGKAPSAIIMKEAEPIIAVGAIISNIPLVDKPESFEFKDGERVIVNADHNEIIIYEEG